MEWAHLFPGNPNRIANVVDMKQQACGIVMESWRVWKVGLGGRMPRPAEILGQALAAGKRYGVNMVFP
ncbi:hypothetical protein [Saccharothrix sp. NRRL B-16348]|uniref:hypothetical protein n=1 Tax=Saccharothrix sp. NRRL B-16348 TaxID=1415542 RepID=UPI0012FC0C81|nr:hypothetical protein [Saccharothrix sp. NRRL B-16348]